VHAGYSTLYGEIKTAWEINDKHIQLSVVIPVNTTASIHLPYSNEVKEVGSGRYLFQYEIDDDL